MQTAAPASGTWADVLGEGRLPLFSLICLAVWLNAADSLITATIMPSVGRALGGYAYFGWATAGYLLGSVLAGASSGILAIRFGLRSATAAGGPALRRRVRAERGGAGDLQLSGRPHPAGCWRRLGGRPLLGRHWPAVRQPPAAQGVQRDQFCLGHRRPDRPHARRPVRRRRVLAAVFWLFAIQGVAVAVAAWVMLPAAEVSGEHHAVAWRQLGLIAIGVTLIALADLAGDFARMAGLTGLGVAAFVAALWLDGRSDVRLLPRGSGDLRTAHGAGYATMFLLNTAAMGLPVYGPAVLQSLRGLSALAAGYVVGAEACSGQLPHCRWRG